MSGTGHYELIVAKRAALVSNLSPAAKHAHFPKLYGPPVPLPRTAEELQREIKDLTAKNVILIEQNKALKAEIERSGQLFAAPVVEIRRAVLIAEIMQAFCDELAKTSYREKGAPLTIADFQGPRRARSEAYARHVAIWLCWKLCKDASLPQIAKRFCKDHTSIMHGRRQAVQWMETVSTLNEAAAAVLERFGTSRDKGSLPEFKSAETEGAGRP